jgi:hypothetical protein
VIPTEAYILPICIKVEDAEVDQVIVLLWDLLIPCFLTGLKQEALMLLPQEAQEEVVGQVIVTLRGLIILSFMARPLQEALEPGVKVLETAKQVELVMRLT